MKHILNIGIIGSGSIAGTHLDAYEKNPAAKVIALCDIDETVLKAKGERYGVTSLYTDYNKMLAAHPELDAISVCTWNNVHAAATIAALELGKCVLCEKPMAMSAAEGEAMLAAEKKGGGRLMIGFVRRYGNDAEIARDFIQSGTLGELYYAKATYIRRNGCPGGWFADKSRSGGGPLIDLGVHVIDLVRYLAGNVKPVAVYGAVFHRLGVNPYKKGGKSYNWAASGDETATDVEDLATAMIRFENDFVLNVETSFALHTDKDQGKIELFGTKGGATINPELTLHTGQNGYPVDITLAIPTALSFGNLFQNEIDHFLARCLDGKPFRSPGTDGLEMMRILDAVYLSAKEKREVKL